MSWKESTIGDVLSVIKNGINCEQNKNPVGNKITRIETISKKRFDFERVGYANLSESEKLKSQLRVGDILFSHINSPIHVGKTAIYEGEEDVYHGINLLLMRTKEEIDPYFFNHFLDHLFSTGYWEENCKKSVNQASVNQKDISKVPFRYPPLSTQKKIVAKLDAIFAEIDKAMAAAETNAKNAEALFQSYLNKIFEENSSNTKKIKDCCLIKPPKSEARILGANDDVSFMPMDTLGINQKFAIPNQVKRLSEVVGSYTYFAEGDVLLAKITPCFENGKLGIAKNLINGVGFGSSEYFVFRPNAEVDPNWLYFYLNRAEFRNAGAKHMSGAVGHKRVTKEFIENTVLPLPSLLEQKKIVADIENLSTYSKSLSHSSQLKLSELETLKHSILRQAFAGEWVKE